MKKVLLFTLIFILSITYIKAEDEEIKMKANDFMNMIVAQEFDDVVDFYDETMKEQFPPNKVKQFWSQILTQYNNPLNFGNPKVNVISGYRAVYIPVFFESITLEARVVFNDENLVAGFFMVPLNNKELYQKPEYADSTKFSEDNYTFGSDYWKLAGTLSVPNDVENPPLVILVHGSGSHDRDETIGPNKPFKDIAWGLASNGIAVLRYDKRNFMHPQKFRENLDTLTMYHESAEDAILAAKSLKNTEEFKNSDIYLLGHSQGGFVIPDINSKTELFDGYISVAGLASDFRETLKRQYLYLFNLDNNVDAAEKQTYNDLLTKIARLDSIDTKEYTNELLPLDLTQTYWEYILNNNIETQIKDIQKPILVINGGKDYQVVELDFQVWKENLKNNDKAEFIWYDNLNHLLMQTQSEKPGPGDYYKPDNIDEQVIMDITNWIKSLD